MGWPRAIKWILCVQCVSGYGTEGRRFSLTRRRRGGSSTVAPVGTKHARREMARREGKIIKIIDSLGSTSGSLRQYTPVSFPVNAPLPLWAGRHPGLHCLPTSPKPTFLFPSKTPNLTSLLALPPPPSDPGPRIPDSIPHTSLRDEMCVPERQRLNQPARGDPSWCVRDKCWAFVRGWRAGNQLSALPSSAGSRHSWRAAGHCGGNMAVHLQGCCIS
ncbi:hypothetical protein GQ53DRAFT_18149 [Thozetella sp. PMI_491]|nr:hypothetical protein GQ53DRAFT_18149 [Thozetella sp. PMI_491]